MIVLELAFYVFAESHFNIKLLFYKQIILENQLIQQKVVTRFRPTGQKS